MHEEEDGSKTYERSRPLFDYPRNTLIGDEHVDEVLFAELFSHRNFPLSRQPRQDIGRNMTKRLIVKTAFFKGANCEQRIGGPIRYTE